MNKTWLVIISLLVLVLLGLQLYDSLNKPQFAYVELKVVFEKFELKKELEQKLKQTLQARQKILDSLQSGLNILARKIEAENEKNSNDITLFEGRREEFIRKKKEVEEDNYALTQKYDNQIYDRMNKYIADFGAEKKYTFIFGKNDAGYLIYGAEKINVTPEVSEYINKKYKGL
jgi:outer membrane protein